MKPKDLAATEQQLIGGLLLYPERLEEVSSIIDTSDLATEPARMAIGGMVRLRKRGARRWVPHDLLAVSQVDEQYLAGAMELMPTDVVRLARLVRENAIERKTINLLRERAREIVDSDDVVQSLSRLTQELEQLRQRASTLGPSNMEAVTKTILRRAAQAKTGARRPVLLGEAFREVTDSMRGLMPGRLYILAGRTGTGKTAVALHWAFYGARRPLFVTSEMTEEDLLSRLMSHIAGIPQPCIEAGDLNDEDFERLEEARRQIMASDFAVLPANDKTADEVTAAIAELHRHRKFDLICHDYLQLFRKPRNAMSEYEAVSHSSRVMMHFAKRLGPPILQLAQLNRETERRENPEPKKSDLRGSGTIEQDADGIFLLHRPADYPWAKKQPMADDPSALLVKMDKNRSGPCGRWYVHTDFRTYRFQRGHLRAV